VVNGLPDVEPALIETPVALHDVSASILAWAGIEAAPGLPTRPGTQGAPTRRLFALYADEPLVTPDTIQGAEVAPSAPDARRAACRPKDRVFGDTVAVLRYPWKLIWFEHHEPQLYDLRWDARELRDQAADQPKLAAEMAVEANRYRGALGAVAAGAPDAEAVEALRSLGYAE
jgi:hypothetical protein